MQLDASLLHAFTTCLFFTHICVTYENEKACSFLVYIHVHVTDTRLQHFLSVT